MSVSIVEPVLMGNGVIRPPIAPVYPGTLVAAIRSGEYPGVLNQITRETL